MLTKTKQAVGSHAVDKPFMRDQIRDLVAG